MTAKTEIVALHNVGKTYGEGEVQVHALNGVNLGINAGEFIAVAGPSGSGKSTMLNLISGLDKPTSGEVVVAGQKVSGMTASQMSRLRMEKIGFVFQSYNLMPVLTAYENAEYVLMLQGVPPKERRERVMAILKRVGIDGMEHRFPRELSGGQQQRVAVARALASSPSLILADEPTANLDSKTGGALMELLAELNEEKGVTFLFATHDQSVMKKAHRLLELHDGQIVKDGLFGE